MRPSSARPPSQVLEGRSPISSLDHVLIWSTSGQGADRTRQDLTALVLQPVSPVTCEHAGHSPAAGFPDKEEADGSSPSRPTRKSQLSARFRECNSNLIGPCWPRWSTQVITRSRRNRGCQVPRPVALRPLECRWLAPWRWRRCRVRAMTSIVEPQRADDGGFAPARDRGAELELPPLCKSGQDARQLDAGARLRRRFRKRGERASALGSPRPFQAPCWPPTDSD